MEKNENTEIDIPDMLTIMKIFSFAAKKTYQPIILFALLINELGVMSYLL
jgi:hypothetical protein